MKKKVKLKVSLKGKKTTLPLEIFKSLPTPDPKLQKEAKKIVKSIHKHFNKDGWDIRMSFLYDELFYNVYGHHLENYILKAIARSNKNYVLEGGFDSELMLKLGKKK